MRARWLAVLVAGVVLSGCADQSVPGSIVRYPSPSSSPYGSAAPDAAPRPATMPSVRPPAQYLEQSYHAPAALVTRRAGGSLRIPSLHVLAVVDAVGLDHGAMALPDDPRRLGWLRSTARAGDRIGASVISGHVSDEHDRPGALVHLGSIRRGARVLWQDTRGERHWFEVVALHRYSRTRGVPARTFRVDGPHVLNLVTCARRITTAGGGFHYTANLVVTARAVPG